MDCYYISRTKAIVLLSAIAALAQDGKMDAYTHIPHLAVYLMAALIISVFTMVFTNLSLYFRHQEVINNTIQLNTQLAIMLLSYKTQVWTYDVRCKLYWIMRGYNYKYQIYRLLKYLPILFTFLFLFFNSPARAKKYKNETFKEFNEEHPLIYEDAWDLWPYVFLNETGEPDGYNIDLLKLIFKELDIPYIIKLKPTLEAQADLKSGKSDLMLRMDATFSRGNSHYSKNIVQLFTHSVVAPQGQPQNIHSGSDLRGHLVFVHEGSFSHHLIKENRWANEIKAFDDMKEAIQRLRSEEQGVIIWNTMSLKWLMRKYKTNNLVIYPIDIPAGEYKFMSRNPRLLERIDSVYTELKAKDKLDDIRNKWFYPERVDSGIPSWIWKLAALLACFAIAFLLYYAYYRFREHQMTREIRKSNDRLSLVLSTSNIGLWIYHVATQTFEWLDEHGKTTQTLQMTELVGRYTPDDFRLLREALADLVLQRKESTTFSIQVKEPKNDDITIRDYNITISVLRREKGGKPSAILGTRVDITEERQRQFQIQDNMMRYHAVFNSAMIDMVVFDALGIIVDINDKASHFFPVRKEDLLKKRITIQEVLGIGDINVDNFQPMYITQLLTPGDGRALSRYLKDKPMYYELKLVPVHDSNGHLLNIFGTGRNVTENARSYQKLQQNIRELQLSNNEVNQYIRNIDYVLHVGGIRMARYNPKLQTLSIFRDTNTVEYGLTQVRALNYVDDSFKRRALFILKNMDGLTNKPIRADIKTTLRKRGGNMLHLQFHFIPVHDHNGQIKDYFGMCRDISEIKIIEDKLAAETLRAQEVEIVKNAFLHNMSFEIRTPLNTVVGFAELFQMEHSQEDEVVFINEIKENSAKLLKLINDILFLSRLDVEMIEFNTHITDFIALAAQHCDAVWGNDQKEDVSYTVRSSYSKLVLEIDSNNIAVILDNIVTNAVQYTDKGSVIVHYDYLGDRLIVAVEDTGHGIPESSLDHIFERFVTGANQGAGLGLSICQELIKRMNGTINIKSKEGKGTTVWFSVPCKALEIERV